MQHVCLQPKITERQTVSQNAPEPTETTVASGGSVELLSSTNAEALSSD